jgi:drug/metabolite transporter (DMT)-like permease
MVSKRKTTYVEQLSPVFRRKVVADSSKLPQLDDSFQFAISPVATVVQMISIMPVCGISNHHPSALKFKLASFRTIFSIIYISFAVFITSFYFTFIASRGISAKTIGNYKLQSC